MKTILFAWELGAGSGHCVNLLPLAKDLSEQGHRVVFAARDLATAKRVFSDTTVTYVQAPFLIGGWSGYIRETHSFAQILHNTGFGTDEHLQVLTDAWDSLFAVFEPEVIVCEHAPHALLAAYGRDVPRFVIGTGFFSPPDLSPLPLLRPPESEAVENAAVGIERDVLSRIKAYLQRSGRSSITRIAQLYADAEQQYLTTLPELDHYPIRANEGKEANITYVRSWSPSHGLQPPWPDGDGPRVFGYLKPGSANWRLHDLIALLAEMRLPAIMHVDQASDQLIKRFENSTVTVVGQPVDISYVSREAQVAILNGNAGTATELLLAGIPQLNIPLHLEQGVFSRRIEKLGASIISRPDQPAQMAARLITLLRSSRFQERAQAVAEAYRKKPLPTYGVVTDHISRCLGSPR